MRNSRRILFLVWFLFVSLTVFVPLPQANATLTQAEPFVTELTGLSFNPYCVDVDSHGWIFVKDHFDNSVWRSKDNGSTWTEVLDLTNHPSVDLVNCIFVDSRDYIHVSMWNSSTIGYFDIYRSINGGDTWSKTLDYTYNLWHMTENSDGVLYVNCYATNHPIVYNSTDNGASWSIFQDLTGTDSHVHTVAVDIATDDVYITLGDSTNVIKLWRSDTKTISTFLSGSTYASVTDLWSDGTYVYLCPDGQNRLVRFPSRGSWEQRETVFETTPLGSANNAFECVRYASEGLVFFGTEKGKLLGSWDNEHWVKLLDLGTSANSIYSISNRRPIYVTRRGVTAGSGRLWRVDIQKEDLARIYYRQYIATEKASEDNAVSFAVEQRLNNGTSYVDLTHVALTNVQATIKGLARTNQYNNSGWETGLKTGWTEATAPLGIIASGDPANGTYYYTRVHNLATFEWLWQGTVPSKVGDVHILSFYVKANATVSNALYIQYQFSPGGSQTNLMQESVSTSWKKVSYGITHTSASYTSFCWILQFNKVSCETHLDSLTHAKLEVGHVIAGTSETDGIQYLEGYYGQKPYFEGTVNTLNPSLSVNGQTVSHTGTLANGTESDATSLTGILTGAVEVSANIQGSGQAILRLTGTRVFNTANVVLQGYEDGWYYGRYYGTPTYPTEKYVLTNVEADITSLSSTSNEVTFTVSSPSGTASTTLVYCGDLQKPKSVSGLSSTGTWTYDDSSKILTIIDTHSSSLSFTVSWSGGASGKYTFTVQVLVNHLPTSAVVQIQNQNQTTDLLGQTHWLLPYGTYDVQAYYGEQTQSMTVMLNEDKTVGFNFVVFPKPPNFTPLIMVLVVIVVALMLFLLFSRKH